MNIVDRFGNWMNRYWWIVAGVGLLALVGWIILSFTPFPQQLSSLRATPTPLPMTCGLRPNLCISDDVANPNATGWQTVTEDPQHDYYVGGWKDGKFYLHVIWGMASSPLSITNWFPKGALYWLEIPADQDHEGLQTAISDLQERGVSIANLDEIKSLIRNTH